LVSEIDEVEEKRLAHPDEAEKYYRALASAGETVRIGMEASGHAQWFERLAELRTNFNFFRFASGSISFLFSKYGSERQSNTSRHARLASASTERSEVLNLASSRQAASNDISQRL
jgi:hypothetical protein